jgi:L-threonylcarbamoyladenylate synthase
MSRTSLIRQAVSVLREGGLVAFPTETVYGLGANARDSEAVARIFAAKGRPADKPLTVHVGSIEQALEWAIWNEDAYRLAAAFWPGPLTLVLPRRPEVPQIVTAGLDTVGVRMPDQRVALELLRAFDGGVAGTSANRSGRLSPTTAAHVREDLGSRVDLVLDDGECRVGIESSVLSLVDQPRLLRTGAVSSLQIEQVLERHLHQRARETSSSYRLDTPVRLVSREEMAALYSVDGGKRVFLCRDGVDWKVSPDDRLLVLPDEPAAYGRQLFSLIRELDQGGFGEILVQDIPDSEEWRAISQRLEAIAGGHSL